MRSWLVGVLVGLVVSSANAQVCQSKGKMEDRLGGKIASEETLTKDQWEFTRGLFAMHPSTPFDLPYGDEGRLLVLGDGERFISFMDGESYCGALGVSNAMADLLDRVKAGDVSHEGGTGL